MAEFKIILPRKEFTQIADMKSRGLAFLIDLLIFFFFIMTPFLSNYFTFANVPVDKISVDYLFSNPALFQITLIGQSVTYILFLFYLSSMELLFKSTIGKKFLNLSVISKKSRSLSITQSVLRNLTKSVFLTFLIFDCILMLFDKEHRRLSDYVTSTIVVENKKRIKTFPVVNEV